MIVQQCTYQAKTGFGPDFVPTAKNDPKWQKMAQNGAIFEKNRRSANGPPRKFSSMFGPGPVRTPLVSTLVFEILVTCDLWLAIIIPIKVHLLLLLVLNLFSLSILRGSRSRASNGAARFKFYLIQYYYC